MPLEHLLLGDNCIYFKLLNLYALASEKVHESVAVRRGGRRTTSSPRSSSSLVGADEDDEEEYRQVVATGVLSSGASRQDDVEL